MTKIVKVDPLNPQNNYIKEAADILRDGGLVVMPTETVYGIAANSANKQTIKKLSEIKKRPQDKPFSLHIAQKSAVENFSQDIPVAAYKLIDKFWPGPLTLILKSKEQGTVGIRMPDDKIALSIIILADVPVVCPSANLSGKPAPINFKEAIKDLEGLVDFAIDAGNTKLGIESTVLDLTVEPLKVLREGAIKKAEIEAAVRKKIILAVCTGNSCRSVMFKALLEKKLRELKRDDVEVLSAGMMMLAGIGASEMTKEVLKKEGIDVSGHCSQAVNPEMAKRADIILVMERMHEERVLGLCPQAKNRLFLLKEFVKIKDNQLDIPDPIGKPLEFYESIFSIIKEAVERIINLI